MRNIFTSSCVAALTVLAFSAQAQTKPAKRFGMPVEFAKCGTVEYETLLRHKNAQRAGKQQFEQWLAPKVAAAKAQMLQKSGQNTSTVVTIPVVVHVIHNGDPVGIDENIADGQILSQITVLNQDFRKALGSMGFNNNPVGADMEIEFCMAQRDPAGINTSGIVRYNMGTGNGWDMEEIEVLKTQTQWDPAKYLNIWLVDEIYAGFGLQLAGYAQFPEASGLDGLDEPGITFEADTDGVVIAADCFGSQEVFAGGNYYPGKEWGRTATHEIGHFFGLRHIWGDDYDCVGNDYCNDTPVAADANSGCPEIGWDSCPDNPGEDMVKNYMDYTDDICQNVFTIDQKARMMAVLANSPRRHSLITSNGCVPGTVYDLDGSLNLEGVNPECGSSFTPQVVLKNMGNTVLTAAVISYQMDNQAPATFNWSGNLSNSQQATIVLPLVNASAGEHTFNVSIASLNNAEDMEHANDNKSMTFNIVPAFNTTQVVIRIQNDDAAMETLWALADGNENFVATNINLDDFFSSDWPEPNELQTMTVDVTDGCYQFGIADLGANGLCCTNGNGYYRIETLEGQVILEGSQFADQAEGMFRIDTSLGIGEVATGLNAIKLYPNPASSILNIAVPQDMALPESYTIYNSLGQIVSSGKFTSAGQQVNISAYSNGAYFIRIAAGDQAKTMQFIKY